MDGQGQSGRLRIDGSCLKCGYCAQVCPVEAIRVKKGLFVIGPGCIGCQACLEVCPAGAVAAVDIAADGDSPW